jgi:osmoprotectant transport system permease protein
MSIRLIKYAAAAGLVMAAFALLAQAIGVNAFHEYSGDLRYYAGRHLILVGYSMALALAVGIPAGVLLSRRCAARYAERLMQVFNVGNTIPSLAVLAIALGIFGIGEPPAVTALFLASLLPITRNTYEGVRQVPAAMLEAARGIGMTPWQALWRVELPNALPIMVGGIRTALAINVGTAPLAYLIGADSLGTLIFPGIYLDNTPQMLIGAAATTVLALALDGIVAGASRYALAWRGRPA